MNKKKWIILLAIITVVIAVTTVVLLVINSSKEENTVEENKNNYSIKVQGKLEEYIRKLSDNYYIKYSGKFKNNSEELTQAIVEYTKSGESFGLRSSELNMHIICNGKVLNTISDRYKLIVEMPKEHLDVKEYNLVADIGQVFVKEYKENIGSNEYDVEEYLLDNNPLKYYFKEQDIKYIKFEESLISIIRLELKTNQELLDMPTGYSKTIM